MLTTNCCPERSACQFGVSLLLAVGLAGSLSAQPRGAVTEPIVAAGSLTLADALHEADAHAFGNRIAAGTAAEDRARTRLPLKGILPTAHVESGIVRTTDPIGAFGTTLRQRRVSPAAFDPARLNDPAAITNVQAGVVLEVPVFNADAWAGRRAALAAADATDESSDWTVRTTRVNVVRAYYGSVLASEKVSTLLLAQRAVDAAARQVGSMMQQGLVTRADLLQADVRATEVASQLVSARNDQRTAQRQFALLLGRTDDAPLPLLPNALPDDTLLRAFAVRDTIAVPTATTVDARADVHAAQAAARSARADQRRAASTLLPRLNSFARYDWNSPTALYGGKPNWTIGVMASWSPFSGGTELADVAVTTARARTARAGEDATRAQARLEADISRRDLSVALERLDLAARAAEQSREAHRLVEKRYAGGLATIAELLGAEAIATGAALSRAAARFAVIDALAAHRRAVGADPAALAALEGTR